MVQEPFYERDGQILIELPGARALFTTASWGDVRDTRARIAERLGVSVVCANQVHGDTVLEVRAAPHDDRPIGDGDALIATVTGLAPMVISADCVPIVIAAVDPADGVLRRRAVAAVHAGWRGLDAGIIARTTGRLRALAPQATLSAAIGPAAGACCYEVDDDLHAVFAQRGQDFRSGARLDLKAIARAQLRGAGVGTVHDVGLCTICSDPHRLFSYRRDHGQTGRQAALVWLT